MSFDNFYTQRSLKQNTKIVSEILKEFTLPIVSINDEIIFSAYFLTRKFLPGFKIKKDVYFVIADNVIMINIRNSDPTRFFSFKDDLEKKILQRLQSFENISTPVAGVIH